MGAVLMQVLMADMDRDDDGAISLHEFDPTMSFPTPVPTPKVGKHSLTANEFRDYDHVAAIVQGHSELSFDMVPDVVMHPLGALLGQASSSLAGAMEKITSNSVHVQTATVLKKSTKA